VALLKLDDVRREFKLTDGSGRTVRAVDGVTLELAREETLAVVGESGSGKTTLGRVITGLTPPDGGTVEFAGERVDWADRKQARALRPRIQMVFQDILGSLDPRWTAHDLIAEPLRNFGVRDDAEVERRVAEVTEEVGLTAQHLSGRPMQLSGGQRQRVVIARAVVARPELVVCDEPVSALDVSIRGQILELLGRLRAAEGLTYLVISHDMSIVQKLADRVATMYLGQIVELSDARSFFERPLHPYTIALLSAVPKADPEAERRRRRIVLGGEAGDASRIPSGCRFHPRCPAAADICRTDPPALREITPGRYARCHFAPDVAPDLTVAPA
jgi:oligopeptide/dipeptide ABC transporter ATP-binding protein